MPWGFHRLSFLLGIITFCLYAVFFWLLTPNIILSLLSHSNPILLFLVTFVNIIPFVMFHWLLKPLQPSPLNLQQFSGGWNCTAARSAAEFKGGFYLFFVKICLCKAKCRIRTFNFRLPGIGTVLFLWVCVCVLQKMYCILILCNCCHFN